MSLRTTLPLLLLVTLSVTARAIPVLSMPAAEDSFIVTLTSDDGGSVVRFPPGPAYASGASVSISATPSWGFVFLGWTGDTTLRSSSFSVTVLEARSYHARFGSATKYQGGSMDGSTQYSAFLAVSGDTLISSARIRGGSYDGGTNTSPGRTFLSGTFLATLANARGGSYDGSGIVDRSKGVLSGELADATRSEGGSFDGGALENFGRASLAGVVLATLANARGGSYDGSGLVDRSKGALSGELANATRSEGGSYDGGEFENFGRASLTGVLLATLPNSRGGSYDGGSNISPARLSLSGTTLSGNRYFGGSYDGVTTAGTSEDLPLSAQLTAFTAESDRLNVDLAWRSATEIDVAMYAVERSAPGDSVPDRRVWDRVDLVEGAGTSTSPKDYSARDRVLIAGRYAYRITVLDRAGKSSDSREVEVDVGLAPRVFTLAQNYPNPFNPTTTIEFTFADEGHAAIRLYDMLGREVGKFFDGPVLSGRYYLSTVDGRSLASGVYIYRLVHESGGKTQMLTKRMMVMK